jgi:hypothetical protein
MVLSTVFRLVQDDKRNVTKNRTKKKKNHSYQYAELRTDNIIHPVSRPCHCILVVMHNKWKEKGKKERDYAVPWPHCRPETRALGVFVGDQFRVSWEDSFSMDENRLFGEEGTQGLRSTGAGGF